jgi:hypothetical protein
MNLIEIIKLRLGIYYSTPEKDAEVQGMADAALLYFNGAGWPISETPSALEIEAIALFCKMAQSTDPALLTNHPVLTSFIVQGRAHNAEI